ncbi:conserved hypothetical protein [Capnocytophaga canimorsus]|uniref:Uncharacterized protein n=1 Tax=Capnocytophaga canimorsus TaxID=28188 RepID=A0A0B7IL21_9FLAO|nr:conserved hypothetical protein [Capnocytophaga canimorsus]
MQISEFKSDYFRMFDPNESNGGEALFEKIITFAVTKYQICQKLF